MGNQQVRRDLEIQFEKKLYSLDTPHDIDSYDRVKGLDGKSHWYVNYFCGNCGAYTYSRWDAFKISTGKCDKCVRRGINFKDGRSSERLYRSVWRSMMSRCYTKSNAKYPRYGGRGITVCMAWHDYLIFRNWALANGFKEVQDAEHYKDYQALDRIDPLKGYSPDNCQFITVSENSAKTKGTRTRKLQRLSPSGSTLK